MIGVACENILKDIFMFDQQLETVKSIWGLDVRLNIMPYLRDT